MGPEETPKNKRLDKRNLVGAGKARGREDQNDVSFLNERNFAKDR